MILGPQVATPVELELHGIRTAFLRRANHPLSELDVAVVIAADLSNDEWIFHNYYAL